MAFSAGVSLALEHEIVVVANPVGSESDLALMGGVVLDVAALGFGVLEIKVSGVNAEIGIAKPAPISNTGSILLVAADEKRLHTFEEMRHATEGWLSATSENMTIHIDMKARKTAPFPPDIRARIEAVVNSHAAVSRPEGIGRKVAMPSK